MIRSLRMQPNRKLYFKEVPMPPTPGPGEVQVRMAFASICGYDMMMLRGTAAYPLNGYLGHEGSGVVTAVGENVRALHPGDRVTINPYEPCGLCDACRSNRPEYCTNPSVGYADLIEFVNGDGKLPEKPLLITIDDGYQNNLDLAAPLLEKYGAQAVFVFNDRSVRVTGSLADSFKLEKDGFKLL